MTKRDCRCRFLDIKYDCLRLYCSMGRGLTHWSFSVWQSHCWLLSSLANSFMLVRAERAPKKKLLARLSHRASTDSWKDSLSAFEVYARKGWTWSCDSVASLNCVEICWMINTIARRVLVATGIYSGFCPVQLSMAEKMWTQPKVNSVLVSINLLHPGRHFHSAAVRIRFVAPNM